MLPGYFSSFAARRQPMMARPSYAREVVTYSTFPVAVAMLEGGVVGVLAKLVFDVSSFGFATIMAAPMFANLTSLVWAKLAHGRRKARFMAGVQALVLLMVAGIALLPTGQAGAAGLIVMVVLGRCAIAGMVAVRTIIWRANYRRHARAGITSRFLLITTLILAIAPLAGYVMLDFEPQLFRIVYPAAALVGAIGALSTSRIRVRREKHLLDYERQPRSQDHPDDVPRQLNGKPHGFISILREDRRFRAYMTWQFFAGLANMMGNTAMIYLITELAQDMAQATFFVAILFNEAIPKLLMTLFMPLWARLLDRVHVAEYRSVHGLLWIVSQLGNYLTAATGSFWLIALPRATQGMAMGGGMLAWNLGHHDFADRRLAPLYMSVHQTLTGIRGFTAPYLGVLLLAGWEARHLPGFTLPGWEGIGENVFLITTGLAVVSWGGFVSLAILIRRQRRGSAP
jgi:hypothetical protein